MFSGAGVQCACGEAARLWRVSHRAPIEQATEEGLGFLRGMGWDRLLESPLNPLRLCLESVAIEVRACTSAWCAR